MRASSRAARVFIAAVTLLLAAVLGVDCASAHVTGERAHVAVATLTAEAAPADHSGTAEDDLPRRGRARQSSGVAAPTIEPGHVCDRYFRTGVMRFAAPSVTVREAVPRARSKDLALLHRAFRC